MLYMHQEPVVSLADLRCVSIECPLCRTKVVLDMEEISEHAKKYSMFAPAGCPGCRVDYDTAVRAAVDQFQKAYQTLMPVAGRVSFHSAGELASLAPAGRI